MATPSKRPIIKIKKGNIKPSDYIIQNGIQFGLTAGEMGINFTNKAFILEIIQDKQLHLVLRFLLMLH